MEQRVLGCTGVSIGLVGQGTWQMEQDRGAAVQALRRGIDLGMTHIDTAEMYGGGAVEELVGEAIDGRRQEVFLASKVLPNNAWFAGTIQACEATLRRLGTSYLDLYLLHWPGQHPLEETFSAFDKLQSEGKIRSYGVSNFDVADLSEAVGLIGAGKIACNQVLYHLLERQIEHEVIPWCQQHGVAVTAYSPFGSGRFPEPDGAGGRCLRQIADAHGATPRQVALRFLLRHEGLFTIPKAALGAHVDENAAAVRLHLTDEEISRINKAFPLRDDSGRLPML